MRFIQSLTLYIAGRRHTHVVETLRRVVRQEFGDGATLRAVDVETHPEAAEADNILATPTLVFSSGRASRRMIGDFSNTEMVLAWLRSVTGMFTSTTPNLLGETSITDANITEGEVTVWIEDNGIGIAPADREKIFRPFERLKSAAPFPGSGVGLAIVKRTVERFGGSVGVGSTLYRGSRFWVKLKRA